MSENRSAVLRKVIRSAAVRDPSVATDRELLRRFARENDQIAFAALVKRHTNLVFGVCRRALPNVPDAEDACQATFLVLANRAKDGRWQESVANWLYTTARKVARNARVAAQRRRQRESGAAVPESVEPVDRMSGRELLAALDAALDGLSPRYREPLVLCYLEGLTRDEAAARLGVPLATLHTRIDRARKRLHEVLIKAGCTLGAGLLALAVCSPAGASPPRLVASILTAASGRVSPAVGELARGVAVNGSIHKVVRALVVLVGVACAGVALGSIGVNVEEPTDGAAAVERGPTPIDPKPNAAPLEPLARPAEKSGENSGPMVTYRGRVLGPGGKPVAGAKLHVAVRVGYPGQPIPPPECATADGEGRFEFQTPKANFMDFWPVVVGSTAPTYGAGWVQLEPKSKTDDLTIHLVNDDAPITGQIVTLEGQPVPGANLTAVEIVASPKEDLGPWLEAVKGKKGESDDLEFKYFTRFTVGMSPLATTDAQGRFKISGIGSNRLVTLRIEGPTVATQHLRVLTRPGAALTVLRWAGDPKTGQAPVFTTYYGADFRYPAAPTKPIVGVVRDADTKKPLAGVTVRSRKFAVNQSISDGEYVVQTTTDKDGRYRLVGMPCGEGNGIVVVPGGAQPYLVSASDVPNTPGLEPVTVDFELKRGIWIEGKITDKATGQPLWSTVEYYALASNPNVRDHSGFERAPGYGAETKADGSYRIAGLPGSGFLVVWALPDYLRVPQRDDEFGREEGHLHTVPQPLELFRNYSAIAAIEPKSGVESVKRDVTLDPGWTCRAAVLDPEGKPLIGARGHHVRDEYPRVTDKMDSAEFLVLALNPRQPRTVLFRHQEKGLVGVMPHPKKNGDSVTVQMQPGATVTGRLLGADGKRRAGAELELRVRMKETPYWDYYVLANVQTDKDGRFRIEALAPDFEFRLVDNSEFIQFGDGLRSGAVKELGDVRLTEGQ